MLIPIREDWVPKALTFSPGMQSAACEDIVCASSYHHVGIQAWIISTHAVTLTSDIAIKNKLFFVTDLVVSCLLPASIKMQVNLLVSKVKFQTFHRYKDVHLYNHEI